MSEMKHTPGPWEWWTSNSIRRLSAGGRDGNVLHAVRLHDGFADVQVSDADAHLIAAAPDLLKALRMAVRQNEDDMILTGEELRVCYAAIDKAKGHAHD